MVTPTRPVEEWIASFESSFTDKQMLNPDYAISRIAGRLHCKLCDRGITGAVDHLRQHEDDLRQYRKDRRRKDKPVADPKIDADAGLPKATVEVVPREGAITPQRRAANRVTSIRYKLNHPEKSGKDKWSKPELAEIHKSLDAAVAALETIRKSG